VIGVFLLALALVRSYGILLDWYGRESKAATTSLTWTKGRHCSPPPMT